MKKVLSVSSILLAFTLFFTACKKHNPDPPVTPPVANFTFTQSDGYVPVTVTFTNTSQNADAYEWNFGNGQTSTEVNPVVTYNTAGTYTVKLKAKKGSTSNEKTVQITTQPLPSASFTVEKLTQYAPMRIKLHNTSQNADTYAWDFGYQGQTSSDPSPEFLYPNKGTFTITLKAKKGTKENTVTQNVIVTQDPTLVAYYPFPGNAFDYSDNNHDATLRGGANYADGRKAGDKSLNLNLTDYNTIRPAAQMPDGLLKSTGTSTSISLWFNAASTSRGCLLSFQDADLFTANPVTQYTPAIYFHQDKLYIKLWNGSVDPLIIKEGVTANAWHHLVVAGDNTEIKAYLDGTLIGTISGAVQYLNMTYNYLGMGFRAIGGTWPGSPVDAFGAPEQFHFNGRIDDVRIYKKKISEAEVAALHME